MWFYGVCMMHVYMALHTYLCLVIFLFSFFPLCLFALFILVLYFLFTGLFARERQKKAWSLAGGEMERN